jgi:soluble lytic murein transglycosylase-like protein
MLAPLRVAVAAALILAPTLPHEGPSAKQGTPGASLRGTLRPVIGAPAPAWLERAVCDRGAELGGACAAVAAAVSEESEAAGLDPVLVLAIIEVESGWDPAAVSSRDAHGLMQLLLPTLAEETDAPDLEVEDAHDPVLNVRAGIRVYARLQRQFADPELAMVAYNAGPGRLSRYLRSEAGVPARFWAYPRAIRRAEARLRARLAQPASTLAASQAGALVE